MRLTKPGAPVNSATPTRHLNPIKAWFIALVGIYGVVSAATPGTFRFLDRVDLVFHEAGL